MVEREIQVLAFLGAPAAGKTVAAAVAKDMGIPVITMGDVVRRELRTRGLLLSNGNAGRVADELRKIEGAAAIARRCIPVIKNINDLDARTAKKSTIVIDGIRSMDEVEAFKNEFGTDFRLVRIDAPIAIRYERIKIRARGDDILHLDDLKVREEREKRWGMEEAMQNADKVIMNQGSVEDFKEEIKELYLGI